MLNSYNTLSSSEGYSSSQVYNLPTTVSCLCLRCQLGSGSRKNLCLARIASSCGSLTTHFSLSHVDKQSHAKWAVWKPSASRSPHTACWLVDYRWLSLFPPLLFLQSSQRYTCFWQETMPTGHLVEFSTRLLRLITRCRLGIIIATWLTIHSSKYKSCCQY